MTVPPLASAGAVTTRTKRRERPAEPCAEPAAGASADDDAEVLADPAAAGERAVDSVIPRIGLILDTFTLEETELGLSELARRVGLPKTSAHRLAEQLVGVGMLERTRCGYRLGPRLFELGQRVPHHRVLRDAALPFMEDLFVATHEAIHLAVPQRGRVFYLERIAGHRSTTTPSRVGGENPMHSTATGKIMLAFSDDRFVQQVVDHGLARITRYTVVVPQLLREQLERARVDGVSIEREETRLGYTSVAAPLFGLGRRVVGALAVTGPTSRTEPDSIASSVRTAALSLSRVLASTGFTR